MKDPDWGFDPCEPSQVVEKANEQDESSNCVVYPYTCTSFTQPTNGFDTIQKTLVKASLRSFVSRRTGVQRQTEIVSTSESVLFQQETVTDIVTSLEYDYCDTKFDDIIPNKFYPYNPENQTDFWELDRFHPSQKYNKVNVDGWRDASKETELGWISKTLVGCLDA